jgi:hypothetical protein
MFPAYSFRPARRNPRGYYHTDSAHARAWTCPSAQCARLILDCRFVTPPQRRPHVGLTPCDHSAGAARDALITALGALL